MSKNEDHLFTLTVEEYKELNRKIFQELGNDLLSKVNSDKEPQVKENDTIFVKEVMELTGYKAATVYSKVCRYEMPVVSRRKPLTFSKKAIMKWMESGKPNLIEMGSTNYLNQ